MSNDREQHSPFVNHVNRFDFTPCLRKAETLLRSLLFFFCLQYFRFAYMLDSLGSASSNFRDDMTRALKTNMIWRFTLPTGACLTWLDLLA